MSLLRFSQSYHCLVVMVFANRLMVLNKISRNFLIFRGQVYDAKHLDEGNSEFLASTKFPVL